MGIKPDWTRALVFNQWKWKQHAFQDFVLLQKTISYMYVLQLWVPT